MMWTYALLAPLLVAGISADSQVERNNGTSGATSSQSSSTSQSSPSKAVSISSSTVVSSSGASTASPSTLASSSLSSSSSSSVSTTPTPSSLRLSSSDNIRASTVSSRVSSSPISSTSQPPVFHGVGRISTANSTTAAASTTVSRSSRSHSDVHTRPATLSRGNSTRTGSCTGCVLEAIPPLTVSFEEHLNPWTSVVVTETIVTQFITYIDGSTIDGVATVTKTLNQTKTVMGSENQTITHSTPVFVIEPTWGVFLTVDAGPTYVIYAELFGGVDHLYTPLNTFDVQSTQGCAVPITELKNWQPTRTQDWSYFIQTYTQSLPTDTNTLALLPSKAVQYLKHVPAIASQFRGSDIATCSTLETIAPPKTLVPSMPLAPTAPPRSSRRPNDGPPPDTPPDSTADGAPSSEVGSATSSELSTGTYLSTTYATTSTYLTVRGCLRCQSSMQPPNAPPIVTPALSNKIADPQPASQLPPKISPPPINPDNPNQGGDNPGEGTNPHSNPGPTTNPGQQISIGNSVYTVRPVAPTPNPDSQNQQPQPTQQAQQTQPNQVPPYVVIGSQTLTQGQSTTINGVPVVVPSDGGGSRIVVGSNTIAINNAPTGAPVLTVGSNTVTANTQGQFVVGTETLKPGGPAITVSGNTYSIASAGSIAVVNGVTQTLANAPATTPPPVLTVGSGQVMSATVVGGSTQFVLGDKTLAPGKAMIVDGTTYSIPPSGNPTAIVINGVTSTFQPGQSALTLANQQSVTATMLSGTSAYIFAPGQTLTPGGVLTVSGTTFSMPASASGSVIVINGVTSTMPQSPITLAAAQLTINGITYTASVRDGTTEFALAQGVTLKPGSAVTVSGTTYSLDSQGTALVINGQTSSIPRVPASNSASTTPSSSVAARSSATTSARDVGNYVWSGLGGGGSTSQAGGNAAYGGGVDRWVERLIIGVAGWLLMMV